MSGYLSLDFEVYNYLKSRVKTTESGCIEFKNKPNAQGYAVVSARSYVTKLYKEKLLHRAIWVSENGPIPSVYYIWKRQRWGHIL